MNSSSSLHADLCVIGAGPAGAAAALHAARAGLDVVVVDRSSFPRDKACGEGILPGGVQLLDDWGLLDEILAAGAQIFRSIDFHFAGRMMKPGVSLAFRQPQDNREIFFERAPAGPAHSRARADLGPPSGLAISRLILDKILLDAAGRAGARLLSPARADRPTSDGEEVSIPIHTNDGPLTLHASFVILATGRSHHASKSLRFGISAHIPNQGPTGRVDVYVRNGYEIYTTAVESGSRVVAILCESATRRVRDSATSHAANSHAAQTDNLRERYARLTAPTDLPTWLRLEPERILGHDIPSDSFQRPLSWSRDSPRILAVGNALVATDPVAAQGISVALRTGQAAANAVIRAITQHRPVAETPAAYAKSAGAYIRQSRLIAATLLATARHPLFGRWILRRIEDQGSDSPLLHAASGANFALSAPQMLASLARATLRFGHGRAKGIEILDEINPAEIPPSTYRFLSFINRFGGGDRASVLAMEDLLRGQDPRSPESREQRPIAVDIGAGDGGMIRRLSQRSELLRRCRWIALDRSLPAHREARSHIWFVVGDVRRLPFRTASIGIAHASLTFHHLAESELPTALAECRRVVSVGIVINDLLRSLHAWLITGILCYLGGDAMVRHDGPLSIRKAFRPEEIDVWPSELSGMKGTFRRHLVFRFTFVARFMR